LALADGRVSEEALADWIRQHSTKRRWCQRACARVREWGFRYDRTTTARGLRRRIPHLVLSKMLGIELSCEGTAGRRVFAWDVIDTSVLVAAVPGFRGEPTNSPSAIPPGGGDERHARGRVRHVAQDAAVIRTKAANSF